MNKIPYPARLGKSMIAVSVALGIVLVGCSSSENYTGADARTSVASGAAQTTSVRQVKTANLTYESRANAPQVQGIAMQESMDQSHPLPVPGQDVVLPEQKNTEKYEDIVDNPVMLTSRDPVTTFSTDVDTGSYANVRRFLEAGQLPPTDAVRIEELINYFSYDYKVPDSPSTPFSITTEIAPSPWNDKRHLLHVGLQGYKPITEGDSRPPANLVFLLDVSGSMQAPNKLGLVKSAIKMLGRQLDDEDSVAIVVYAGASGVVLEPTSASNYPKIATAVEALSAGGSTNGEAGIALAYQLAASAYKPEGINRVILATDGDFNVGLSDIDRLKELIVQKRDSGIALTTLGFGSGNYNDHLMENLADIGNGAYAYIDSLAEARKVLVEELDATLMTIAKDVKIQIEFNPAKITEYRLIGYVNRRLANEDFNNDKVDAGEMGAGHSVTALYEIALAGRGGELNTPLRYSAAKSDARIATQPSGDVSSELLELRLRYKPVVDAEGKTLASANSPAAQQSKLLTKVLGQTDVSEDLSTTSEAFRFSAAIAAFGQQLRQGKFIGSFTLSDTIELAEQARGRDKFGYRAAFVQLARLAETLLLAANPLDWEGNTNRQKG